MGRGVAQDRSESGLNPTAAGLYQGFSARGAQGDHAQQPLARHLQPEVHGKAVSRCGTLIWPCQPTMMRARISPPLWANL